MTTRPTDETSEHTRKHIDEMQHSQPDRPQLLRVGPARHVSNISDLGEGADFIVLTDGQKGHLTLCDVFVHTYMYTHESIFGKWWEGTNP